MFGKEREEEVLYGIGAFGLTFAVRYSLYVNW